VFTNTARTSHNKDEITQGFIKGKKIIVISRYDRMKRIILNYTETFDEENLRT
jgi:hypothetical protein